MTQFKMSWIEYGMPAKNESSRMEKLCGKKIYTLVLKTQNCTKMYYLLQNIRFHTILTFPQFKIILKLQVFLTTIDATSRFFQQVIPE